MNPKTLTLTSVRVDLLSVASDTVASGDLIVTNGKEFRLVTKNTPGRDEVIRQVGANLMQIYDASWSPDGNRLAYLTGAGAAIYDWKTNRSDFASYELMGKNFENLHASTIRWNPEGTQVGFFLHPSGKIKKGEARVYLTPAELDGKGKGIKVDVEGELFDGASK